MLALVFQIATGGVVGIVVAVLVLWYGFGVDPLNIMTSGDAPIALPPSRSAEQHEVPQPSGSSPARVPSTSGDSRQRNESADDPVQTQTPLRPSPSEILTSSKWTWSEPVNLGPIVNSSDADVSPAIAADGLTLIFASQRPGGYGGWDLWMSSRATVDSAWTTPVNLGPAINTGSNEGGPCIADDGLSLIYWSNRSPSENGDLWMASRAGVNEPWGEPVLLETVNSPHADWAPFITPDGLTLGFSSDRPGGLGDNDIWLSTRSSRNAAWEPPVNLGPEVNSEGREEAGALSSDGRTLIFGSLQPGPTPEFVLWMSTRPSVDEPFGNRSSLGPTMNRWATASGASLSNDGETLYFHSNYRGGSGSWDLWSARRVSLDEPRSAKSENPSERPSDADEPRFNRDVLRRITEAVEADDTPTALELARQAALLPYDTDDRFVFAEVQSYLDELSRMRAEWDRVNELRTRLREKPDDAEANLTMGLYFSTIREDWARGLPMLAKGSNVNLAAIAARDLAPPLKNTREQREMGDAWWSLADSFLGKPEEHGLRLRAYCWYERALPHLARILHEPIQQRLDAVFRQRPPSTRIGVIREFKGHPARVMAVAFSPNGRLAVSSSDEDGENIRLWSVETGQQLGVLGGHAVRADAVSFMQSGDHIVSGGADSMIRVWSMDGSLVRTLQGHGNIVRNLAISPDGRFLFSASHDSTVGCWNLGTGQPIWKAQHPHAWDVVCSTDGSRILSTGDGGIRQWNPHSGSAIHSFDTGAGHVNAVAISANGKTVATGGRDRVIELLEVDQGQSKPIGTLPGHAGGVIDLKFLPDGRLLSCSWDGAVSLWDVTQGKELHRFEGVGRLGIAISPDGKRALSHAGGVVYLLGLPPLGEE